MTSSSSSPTAPQDAIEQAEWERRFKQRIVDVLKGHPLADQAQSLAESEMAGAGFEYLSDGFESDPEGSADSAMSYWEE